MCAPGFCNQTRYTDKIGVCRLIVKLISLAQYIFQLSDCSPSSGQEVDSSEGYNLYGVNPVEHTIF